MTNVSFATWKTPMTSIRNAPMDIASARILHYLRTHNYDDCAVYINRLSSGTFRKILAGDLSIDILLAQLPFSIEVFEVIYSKVFLHDPDAFPLRLLKPERIISRMISIFASSSRIDQGTAAGATTTTTTSPPPPVMSKSKDIGIDDERLFNNLSSILRIISYVQPILFKRLLRQRETIDTCILYFEQGHSITTSRSNSVALQTSTSTASSTVAWKNLEETVRHELEATIVCCQQALHRLEMKPGSSRAASPMPSSTPKAARKHSSIGSVQSLNSLDEIQNRLYQHQSLLNHIEPYLSRTKLYTLLDNLGYKVSIDKQILLAYSHIKNHEKQLPLGEPLLPLFKRFAFAYEREWCFRSLLDLLSRLDDNRSDSIVETRHWQYANRWMYRWYSDW